MDVKLILRYVCLRALLFSIVLLFALSNFHEVSCAASGELIESQGVMLDFHGVTITDYKNIPRSNTKYIILDKFVVLNEVKKQIKHPCFCDQVRSGQLDAIDREYRRRISFLETSKENSFDVLYDTRLCDEERGYPFIKKSAWLPLYFPHAYYNELISIINNKARQYGKHYYPIYTEYTGHIFSYFEGEFNLGVAITFRVMLEGPAVDSYYPILIIAYSDGTVNIITNISSGICSPLGVVDFNDDGCMDIVVECSNFESENASSIIIFNGLRPTDEVFVNSQAGVE